MLKGKLEISGDWLTDLFKAKTPPLIGVDISSSSVKMVELGDGGKGRIRLERYAIEPLPKDAVVDGNIMNLEAVGDSLRRGWKRMGSRIKNLAMALPSAQVITKKITVPAGLREDELEAQVETEANQYIPFALEEVNLDFQVLGPAPNSPEDVEVMIAASRKEKVEDRVAVAEVGGLKAVVMDIDAFAAQTAFELMETQLPDGGRDQVIALLHANGCFGRNLSSRAPRFHFDETQRLPFPANEVQFTLTATAPVLRNDDVAMFSKIKVGFLFTTSTGL